MKVVSDSQIIYNLSSTENTMGMPYLGGKKMCLVSAPPTQGIKCNVLKRITARWKKIFLISLYIFWVCCHIQKSCHFTAVFFAQSV